MDIFGIVTEELALSDEVADVLMLELEAQIQVPFVIEHHLLRQAPVAIPRLQPERRVALVLDDPEDLEDQDLKMIVR